MRLHLDSSLHPRQSPTALLAHPPVSAAWVDSSLPTAGSSRPSSCARPDQVLHGLFSLPSGRRPRPLPAHRIHHARFRHPSTRRPPWTPLAPARFSDLPSSGKPTQQILNRVYTFTIRANKTTKTATTRLLDGGCRVRKTAPLAAPPFISHRGDV